MLASFIAYSLFLYVMGLGQRTELLMVIGVIHLFFIYRSIQLHYRKYPEDIGNYMSGVARGMEASVIGVVGLTLFVALFLVIDQTLLKVVRDQSSMAVYLTPFTISLFILTSGLMVSLIGSYILTRILDISIKKQDV
jgi:hypothetical protein